MKELCDIPEKTSMTTIDLSGSVALITGGSRGIGAACARMYAKSGADVALLYSTNVKAARSLAEEIRSLGGKALFFKTDIAELASCRRAVRKVLDACGTIDHLVNSAGIWEYGPIATMSRAAWERTISINLTGTFNMCRLVSPVMIKQGAGCIINLASTAGQRGEPFYSHYAASKGGTIAFSKSLALELAPHRIRVNCVAPGWVDTDMVAHVFREGSQRRKIFKSIPRGRIATPDEIAGPVLFLSSDLASHIIGEVINVNGGSVLCG